MDDGMFGDMDGDPLNGPTSRPSKKAWKRHYTKVPDAWKRQLQKARHPGATYALALELLYLHWQDGGGPVVASDKVATAAGLSLRSKSNALAELKRLGLVRVKREQGKAPRVTLLHTKIGK